MLISGYCLKVLKKFGDLGEKQLIEEAATEYLASLPKSVRPYVEPRIVRTGVDWFQVNVRLDFATAVAGDLRRALVTARKHGAARFEHGPLVGEVKATTREREGILRCRDFRIKFQLPEPAGESCDPRVRSDANRAAYLVHGAPERKGHPRRDPEASDRPIGWNVNVTWEHDGLVAAGLHNIGPWTRALLVQLGVVIEWRLTRFDLAVDVAGWPFEEGEHRRIATKGHSKVRDYWTAEDDFSTYHGAVLASEFHLRDQFLGWVVSPGNELLVRCYAKDVQAKKMLEHDAWVALTREWRDGGAKPGEPIRRLEVQLRGTVLDEMNVRDPMALPELADRVWAYVVDKAWLRMILPTRSRRARCDTDPRWKVFAKARFAARDAAHEIEPIARVRRRGGSRVEQTLGCVLSTLGAAGLLVGMALPTELWMRNTEPEKCAQWTRETIHMLFERASEEVATRMLEVKSPLVLAEHVREVLLAKQGRFTDWRPPERVPIRLAPDVAEDAARLAAELRARRAAA